MGKICPQCNYHFPDEPIYQYPPKFGCEHNFVDDTITGEASSGTTRRWRCTRCLEIRYTNE